MDTPKNRSPPAFKRSQQNIVFSLINLSLFGGNKKAPATSVIHHKDGGQMARTKRSDGLGGAVVDQTLSVLEGDRDSVVGHTLVL